MKSYWNSCKGGLLKPFKTPSKDRVAVILYKLKARKE